MTDEKDPQGTPKIIVTEGPAVSNDRGSLNAWPIVFVASVLILIAMCLWRPDPYWKIMQFVPDGLLITFGITIISICIAVPLGLITGLGKLARNPVINLIASMYVEVIRGIPLLMQLFYIYYALGSLLKVSPMVAAVTALSVCYGAYMGEVFRAGILAVPKGQTEAARSLGFDRFQTMFTVVLPQALRTIVPPVGNECIALLKDTSLVSIIAVADLLRRGREYASQTFEYFETYTVIALVYLIITLLLSKGLSHVEGRLSRYDRRR
ncbi:MAG: amino acid ABC transporter permease [Desulfovibrionaceae bacterium]|nr:amino acid ABC transporter permease [Desulfovibrionaceae bacterium]